MQEESSENTSQHDQPSETSLIRTLSTSYNTPNVHHQIYDSKLV